MYRLTAKMEQHLREDLEAFHALFDNNQCDGWLLEELLVRAIRADNRANHRAIWQERGHDDHADIRVDIGDGEDVPVQVKAGKVKPRKETLTISGHRLGRFNGDLADITDYLNAPSADIISVPYKGYEDTEGKHHEYTIFYIDKTVISGITSDDWKLDGTTYKQTNNFGTEFSLRPKMSWQIWWDIPLSAIEKARVMKIK